MSLQTLALTPTLLDYLRAHSVRAQPVLDALYTHVETLGAEKNMQIAREQGALLALLIKLMRAKKVLELGTFMGYSALVMALALPVDGTLLTCDIHTEWTRIAEQYWQAAGVKDKIRLRLGPALETLADLRRLPEAELFDFIFIDADKANYPAYYEQALALLRPGGLIAIDNVLWYGRVAMTEEVSHQTLALRQLNDQIYADERVELCMLPIGDGLTLALKKDKR